MSDDAALPRPLPYQVRWRRDPSPFKVCEKSRRIGLSWIEALDAVAHASGGGGNVTYQSYDHDMTRQFVADCEFWIEGLNAAVAVAGETLLDLEGGGQVQAFRILFNSGKHVVAVSSAPRAFRSKGKPGDRAIIDEAAFVDNLEEVLKAANAFMIWGGEVHVISTHNGEASAFNTLCRSIEEGEIPGTLHRVTFEDAVADGLFERICQESGQPWSLEAERAWVDDVYRYYGAGAGEELDCIPAAGSGSWLSWGEIRQCEHADAGDPDLYAGKGHCYIGNDIGRRRHLWVAWVIEVIGDVAWTREIRELRGAPFSEQDDTLDELVERYNPVRVAMDQTGMGEKPVEDAQRRYGEHVVEGVIMTGPARLNLATALKERYEDRTWRAPAGSRELRNDLHAVKKETGVTGGPRLIVDDKQKESHADRFWAAALAAGAAASPYVKFAYTPARAPARAPRGRRRRSGDESDDHRPARRQGALGGFVGHTQFGRGLP